MITSPDTVRTIRDLDCPDYLGAAGLMAHRTIARVLRSYRASTGGCRTFYSPAEWVVRRESYGTESHLIIVYDGGEVGDFFSFDRDREASREAMKKALAKVGLYTEEQTGWYSAVYDR